MRIKRYLVFLVYTILILGLCYLISYGATRLNNERTEQIHKSDIKFNGKIKYVGTDGCVVVPYYSNPSLQQTFQINKKINVYVVEIDDKLYKMTINNNTVTLYDYNDSIIKTNKQ